MYTRRYINNFALNVRKKVLPAIGSWQMGYHQFTSESIPCTSYSYYIKERYNVNKKLSFRNIISFHGDHFPKFIISFHDYGSLTDQGSIYSYIYVPFTRWTCRHLHIFNNHYGELTLFKKRIVSSIQTQARRMTGILRRTIIPFSLLNFMSASMPMGVTGRGPGRTSSV